MFFYRQQRQPIYGHSTRQSVLSRTGGFCRSKVSTHAHPC